MRGFSRFYFVTHSADVALQREAAANDDPNFVLWSVEQLAALRDTSADLSPIAEV